MSANATGLLGARSLVKGGSIAAAAPVADRRTRSQAKPYAPPTTGACRSSGRAAKLGASPLPRSGGGVRGGGGGGGSEQGFGRKETGTAAAAAVGEAGCKKSSRAAAATTAAGVKVKAKLQTAQAGGAEQAKRRAAGGEAANGVFRVGVGAARSTGDSASAVPASFSVGAGDLQVSVCI